MAGEEASERGEEGIWGEPRGERSDRGESEAWGRGPRRPGPYPLTVTVSRWCNGSTPDAARVGATGEEGDLWGKRKQNSFIKTNLASKIPF
ncbi:hypothetical protein CFC21_068061 [Triticum aestivum]|uniref:Uncharacterized protein n=3 Tax=Triticum TaxID=4564 RepID=A0A9R0WT11_TRITD|nr:hypothetical protein CFC21_068061 [Triticum aestivum]VAI22909.1 unnamed protein product [Triticum turgidum subsp. durum]